VPILWNLLDVAGCVESRALLCLWVHVSGWEGGGVTQIRPKIRFDISKDKLVFNPIAHSIYHKNTANTVFVNCNNFANFITVFYHFINLL
jgi:hypothetical protein